MRIKKFTAETMREALLKIKEELGEDAIILNTRRLSKKIFPLLGKEEIEVTAAIDETSCPLPAMPPITLKSTGVYSRPKSTFEEKEKVEKKEEITSSSAVKNEDKWNRLEVIELKENLKELRELIKGILQSGNTASAGGFTGGWAVLYKKLIDAEVKPDIATELIKKIDSSDIMVSDAEAEKKFIDTITSVFPVAGPLKLKDKGPLIVVFIGPTGSGKTTTLAKLASHCRLAKNKKVSIMTADTYRIAAIEQIRVFADIIGASLKVVFSTQEVSTALKECADDDVIFVDTAGRSKRNIEHLKELKELLEVLKPDQIHLVLSATTKDSDLLDSIEHYKSLGVNRLLFTKLDETDKIGNILNTVYRSNLPVSYFTTGQSVPDDIELAQTSRFVNRLLGGSIL